MRVTGRKKKSENPEKIREGKGAAREDGMGQGYARVRLIKFQPLQFINGNSKWKKIILFSSNLLTWVANKAQIVGG